MHDVWPAPALVHCIYIWGLLLPNRILPGAKFTLRLSLAFSYIGSVTARHSSSGRQPNFVAWYKEWITELSLLIFLIECATYISRAATLGIGPHSSFSYSFKCETKFNEQTVSKTILTNSLVKFNNRSLHCHRCSLHSHFIRLQAVRQYKLPLHSSVTVMVSLTANSAMAHRAHLRDSCHDL